MKLWVTQNSSSVQPQRRAEKGFTCTYMLTFFYRNSYTVYVRLMSEARFENAEQKEKGTGTS